MTLALSVPNPSVKVMPPVRITVEQYHRMIETGILKAGDRIELLDGQLVRKDRSAAGEDPMSVGKRHAVAIGFLIALDKKLARLGCSIRVQVPATLSKHNEPEPDGAIVRGPAESYLEDHPKPHDISCMIEVSDSSLAEDRGRKQRIYADAGIPQYLIVNLVDDVVEEYTQPMVGRGRYAKVTPFPRGKRVELRTPDGKVLIVPVRSLLP
jgi:Uma2 family endonuclease